MNDESEPDNDDDEEASAVVVVTIDSRDDCKDQLSGLLSESLDADRPLFSSPLTGDGETDSS